MIKVSDITDYLNEIAPFSLQEEWDNSGFLIGDPDAEIHKIGFCLDMCPCTLENAKKENVQLVVTHHPVIFKAQKSFLSGNTSYEAAKAGISVVSVHTCFDAADGGVNDILCDMLGFFNVHNVESICGDKVIRIAETVETNGKELARKAADILKTTVRLSDTGKRIRKVAVCGGSGGSLWQYALMSGADVYITGEADHHDFLEAAQAGLSIIAAGHYETENPAVIRLMEKIAVKFPEIQTVYLNQPNPLEYIV